MTIKEQVGAPFIMLQVLLQLFCLKRPTRWLGWARIGALVSLLDAGVIQAWHTSKLALLSGILYVPTALAMLGIGWSSTKRQERRWHCAVPLVISGIAFMWAASPMYPL